MDGFIEGVIVMAAALTAVCIAWLLREASSEADAVERVREAWRAYVRRNGR